MSSTTELNTDALEQRRQGILSRRLRHARKMVTEKTNEVRRAAAAIGRWSKRVTYYEREITVTLAQKRAQRESSLEKRRKRRAARKIAL